MKNFIASKYLAKVEKDYNKIAKDFSQTRQSPWPEFTLFKEHIEELTKKEGSKSILDLGCGNGRLLTFISPYLEAGNIKYLGVDISKGLIEKAQELHPKQQFIRGSQVSIPLPDNSVDQVWNIAAFHHLPSQKLRAKALKEIKRVLKPNGKLIMTNWNLNQKKYRTPRYKAIFRAIITLGIYSPKDRFISWSKTGVERYYYSFTPKELVNLLQKNNFQVMDNFCTKKEKTVPFEESYNICTVAQTNNTTFDILDIPINTLPLKSVVEKIYTHISKHTKKQLHIATPNPEIILKTLKNPTYKKIIQTTDLNTPDGIGILWAATFLQSTQNTTSPLFKTIKGLYLLAKIAISPKSFHNIFPERVTGTDILKEILTKSPTNKPSLQNNKIKVFLLGAAPGIVEKLAQKFANKNPNITICGAHSGSPSPKDTTETLNIINKKQPDLLFVAFGAPKQELWIRENLPEIPSVKVAIGVGGAFDFLAGKRKRAPKWMRKIGLEWLYRLIQEPKRIKRIYNATIKFPITVIKKG